MQKAPCFFVLLSLFCWGCQDISVEKNASTEVSPFPLTRTLTDLKDRQIEARVLGKQGTQFAIEKMPEQERFILLLENLSPSDQNFLSRLPDGGTFREVKAIADKQARLAGRVAKWHTDMEIAEKESKRLDLPLLIIVLTPGNPRSDELEKKLIFWESKEFSNWASQNVVLAILRVDTPLTSEGSSVFVAENRKAALRYGVSNFSSPTVLVVNQGKKQSVAIDRLLNPKTVVTAIKAVL